MLVVQFLGGLGGICFVAALATYGFQGNQQSILSKWLTGVSLTFSAVGIGICLVFYPNLLS